MALPGTWRRFIDDYVSDESYWHIPKGRVVNRANLSIIRGELQILSEFQSQNKIWNDVTQREFALRMQIASYYMPRLGNASAARARMEKVVFSLLGLAWVNEERRVSLTSVGSQFLTTEDPLSVATAQVQKFQLWNPSLPPRFSSIQLLPHHVLLKVVKERGPISVEEFCLFVVRCRSAQNVELTAGSRIYEKSVLAQIDAFRDLSSDNQNALIAEFDQRGPTVWRTVRQDSGYILSFLTLPHYLSFSDGQIEIVDEETSERLLRFYSDSTTYIQFQHDDDWFDYFGQYNKGPTFESALEYYEDIGLADKAIETFKQAVAKAALPTTKPEEEYELERIQEKELEDWLEAHLDALESGLTLYQEASRRGRQYRTPDAGIIDLLAVSQIGEFVVIELKRSKASDEAFGQLFRYIGWVRLNLLPEKLTRGYIVGDTVDEKLVYAFFAHDTVADYVASKTYKELGISFEDLGYDASGIRRVNLVSE